MRRDRRLPIEALTPYLLELPEPPRPLCWSEVFGNTNPVELEVGFGKGLFLLTASQAFSTVNFVGVEILKKYQLFTATRLAKRHLSNVRVAKADAREFVRDCVPGRSLQAIHVYFPDPWWKKRHKKRRVFTPDFATQCDHLLVPGGQLHLATDVEEYFQVMTELVAQNTVLTPVAPTEGDNGLSRTNFERKSREQGRPVYRGCFEARPVAPS